MTTTDALVKIAGLYENESAAGNRYFVGYCGGVKYVILRNRDAGEKEPQWNLFIAQRPERTAEPGAVSGLRALRPCRYPSEGDHGTGAAAIGCIGPD